MFSAAISNAFPTATDLPPAIVAPISNPKFGDYQCNSSMQLAKLLSSPGAKPPSPRDVATKILENIPKSPLINKCEIAGPGFINVYLDRAYAERAITSILSKGVQPPAAKRQRVVIDFSSPNIGKRESNPINFTFSKRFRFLFQRRKCTSVTFGRQSSVSRSPA